MTDYHADPAPEPSLSASLAHVLCSQTPRHAWTQHPRLNPDYEREESDRFDIGNVVHAILLEQRDPAEVLVSCDHPDWRSKAAREERDAVRAAGKIPLLADQWRRVLQMTERVLEQILAINAELEIPLLTDGVAESVHVWEERGTWFRAKLDWLRADADAIDDLKTTSASADPARFSRRIIDQGGDIQAAFYRRAVEQGFGRFPAFRWIVCETAPPFAVSVLEPAPDVLAVGESKVDWAIARWRELMADPAGPWPAYPESIQRVELPPWEEARWLERMEAGV